MVYLIFLFVYLEQASRFIEDAASDFKLTELFCNYDGTSPIHTPHLSAHNNVLIFLVNIDENNIF